MAETNGRVSLAMTARDWVQIAINTAVLVAGLLFFNWRLDALEGRFSKFEGDYVRKETLDARLESHRYQILREVGK